MAAKKKTTKTTTPAAKPAPAAKTVEPVEAAVKVGQEAVETMVKTNTEVAKKGVEKVVAISEEQFAAATKAGADAYKGYEDFVEFSKSNVDAFVKSNEILSSGVTAINTSVYQLAQTNFEQSIALAQKIMSCKSLAEIVELQSDLAKEQYTKTVAESRKLSEQTIKLAEQASKPIADRVTVAVETLSKPLAA